MILNKKFKTLIYIILFVFTLTFVFPIYVYALDKDSIYVWSNNSSAIETSATPNKEDSNSSEENSR